MGGVRKLLWVAALATVGVGCGDDDVRTGNDGGIVLGDGSTGDGGGGRDAATDAPVSSDVGTCAAPLALAGEVGTVSITVNTAAAPDGPLDMDGCGQGDPEELLDNPPQSVIAYTVPGTGPMTLNFTTVSADTPEEFDTVIQVRSGTACADPPAPALAPSCFDDSGEDDYRSTGALTAMGGQTVIFVVTGYNPTDPEGDFEDRGTFKLTVTARTNATPTATTVSLEPDVEAESAVLTVVGSDADGDVLGAEVALLDDTGMQVDLDGDEMVDENDLLYAPFDVSLAGMMSFTATITLDDSGFPDLPPYYSILLDAIANGARQVRVRLIDEGFSLGPAAMGAISPIVVGFGEMCDTDNVCSTGFECRAGTCQAPVAVEGACMAATTVTVATPTAMTTSATASGMVGTMDGLFEASCGEGAGVEALYKVVVPEGDFDLIASTGDPGIGDPTMADTILSIRTTCGNPGSEAGDGCNDDRDPQESMTDEEFDLRSTVEVRDAEAGTYTIIVDQFFVPSMMMMSPAALPFELKVSLRPVIGAGTACDPDEVNNRCSTAPCPDVASPVCPPPAP